MSRRAPPTLWVPAWPPSRFLRARLEPGPAHGQEQQPLASDRPGWGASGPLAVTSLPHSPSIRDPVPRPSCCSLLTQTPSLPFRTLILSSFPVWVFGDKSPCLSYGTTPIFKC